MKFKVVLSVLLLLVVGFFSYPYFLRHFVYTIDKIDVLSLTGKYDFTNETGTYYGDTVNSTNNLFANSDFVKSAVLGDSTGEDRTNKRISVDLANQLLYAYDGDDLRYIFKVSTGLWGTTPTGNFEIWTNLKSTRMTGGSKELGTYYNLPNVPFTMYYYNDEIAKSRGYSLHGAYWHNNFGNPMSHGCVNLSPTDAETLFYWVNPNFPPDTYMLNNSDDYKSPSILIYGEAPPY